MKTPPSPRTCGCKPAAPVTPSAPPLLHKLEITSEELLTLGIILRKIGGSPQATLRGYAQSLSIKLEEQTVLPYKGWRELQRGDNWPSVSRFSAFKEEYGGIVFQEEPTELFRSDARKMDVALAAKPVAETISVAVARMNGRISGLEDLVTELQGRLRRIRDTAGTF